MPEKKDIKRERSIFFTILIPMLFLLIVEGFLFAGIIAASGVMDRLNQNDRDIIDRQLENRKQYLESYLVDTVSDLSKISDTVNTRLKALISEGVIDMETFDDTAADVTPLLQDVTDELIRTMRDKHASGIFLIITTEDLTDAYEKGDLGMMPGIYIRDLDPGANPSPKNDDLLFKCAPTGIVRSFGITSDTGWKPMFTFNERYHDYDFEFLYRPLQTARDDNAPSHRASDYAHWSVSHLFEDNEESLVYSIPLILDDGTKYGVIGVDLTISYLQSLMPHRELFSNSVGTYVLATEQSDEPNLPLMDGEADVHPAIVSGLDGIEGISHGSVIHISKTSPDGFRAEIGGVPYYIGVETFRIYNSASPVKHDRWLLLGAVTENDLGAFSNQIIERIMLSAFLMIIFGVFGSILIGRRISNSVKGLSDEVANAKAGNGTIPELSRTGISEIDQLTGAITELSHDIEEVKALERKRIEHERDHDLLTGLMNRRCFYRVAEKIFATPEYLDHAAVVMLDLDDLKDINDSYGHTWGDTYIRHAASTFEESVPENTIVARVSGDEFFILYYGYEDYDEIDRHIETLRKGIRDSEFVLPGGNTGRVNASGGVAKCPVDSNEFTMLMRLADFAMYQAKLTEKGRIVDFDSSAYMKQSSVSGAMKEFDRILADNSLITYHFQPIFSASTGGIFACEALMRVSMNMLKSPGDVLQMARQLNRLKEVERFTWIRTLECYGALSERGAVAKGTKLFINSVANIALNMDELNRIASDFAPLIPDVVIEITEAELMDEEATRVKRMMPGFGGDFALDDYGSGYNSQKTLLALNPKYIKVDISIIRDIDSSSDKQRLVTNVVSYAHERDMFIIAEGIETRGELNMCIELGVDLLQGFFLARPGEAPPPISEDALAVINSHADRKVPKY